MQNSKLSIRQAQDPEFIEGQFKVQSLETSLREEFLLQGGRLNVREAMTPGRWNVSSERNEKAQQKIPIARDFLTEYNTGVLYPDLIASNLSQNTNNVKSVDPTGIEPANPELSGPDVHQHRAHMKLVYQITSLLSFRPLSRNLIPSSLRA